MQVFDPLDGALLIDKPAGPTSHDIVDRVRRQFYLKKVGHCGTLDPNATGLLVLLLGKATRLSEKLMGADKVYEGNFKLGEATSTHDADGELTSSLPVPMLDLGQLNEIAGSFVGDLMQVPPMVSAIKKDGVPLYKLARKGIEVERKPRLVHIYNFRIVDYQEPRARFRIACTKGTYIRVLAHEFGEKVGCGAFLETLRRLSSGSFDVRDASSFEEILQLSEKQLRERVIPFMQLTQAAGAV